MATIDQKVECGVNGKPNSRGRFSQSLQPTCCLPATVLANYPNSSLFGLHITFEACRRAGIVAVSARQLKPIEKLMMKLTTKSQIELGQARY